jgi:hypothetical protein
LGGRGVEPGSGAAGTNHMPIIHSSEDLQYVSVQFVDSKEIVTEAKQFLFVELDNVEAVG